MVIRQIINLGELEKLLYCSLDVSGVKGKTKFKQSINIGCDIFVDISIKNHTGNPISNSSEIENNLKLSLNFRFGNKQILRLDNAHHGKVHLDRSYNNQNHIFYESIGDSNRLSQVISDAFEEAKIVLEKECPDMEVIYSW
ncbi:MAG: hypothetical protein V1824_02230 [archaeon]